jgi:hypothetical protein
MRRKILSVYFLAALCLGCTARPEVRLVPGVGVNDIPSAIAVYPLLTGESKTGVFGPIKTLDDSGVEHDRVYIQPPSETKLLVTEQSQQMTDLLLAELSYQGFEVKELPVQVPDEWGGDADGNPTFYISVGLLEHLKESFGLQAIILGNVYFESNRRGDFGVKAAHLRLVDIGSLDVLCHVSVSGGDFSMELAESAEDIAAKLARMANLPTR